MRDNDPGGWRRLIWLEYMSAESLETFTAEQIAKVRTRPVGDLGEEYATSLEWMSTLSRQAIRVPPALLSEFVAELARLATNLGQPSNLDHDVTAALHDAIAAQRRAGGPVSGLYLALAAYLGTSHAESPERGEAIDHAVVSAEPGSDDWGSAMVAKCAYEVSISRYRHAIRTAHALRTAVSQGLNRIFECGALTHEGTALYTSFHDLEEADRLLHRAVSFADLAETDLRVARWIATAYHYRGRVAEALGDDASALKLYLQGKEYQDRCPEEIEANTFLQLRLAEPLSNADCFGPALDHLRAASRLARAGANTGSASVQVNLGFATLKAKQGDLPGAEDDGRKVLAGCREIAFRRGELLALGFLFTIRVRRRRYLRAIGTLARIVPTLATGELRRNNIFKLRANIPLLLRMAFRRVARVASGSRRPDFTRLTGCPCPLHAQPTDEQEAQPAPSA